MAIGEATRFRTKLNNAGTMMRKKDVISRPVVAVIDGAPEFLGLMYEALSDQSYQTILWTAGRGAFEMIVREDPDLVIIDAWLEHHKAREMVLSFMKVDPATKKIPVIITTTDPKFVEEKTPLLQDEHCYIVLKPFDLNNLLGKIEKLVRHPNS
jgi:DNA-binding response OmpR family regulator